MTTSLKVVSFLPGIHLSALAGFAAVLRAEPTRGHFMGRFRLGVPFMLILSLTFFFDACGGNTSSSRPLDAAFVAL